MVTVITGSTLSGKSTLAKYLIHWGYRPILEYTTRPMREGEEDGVDYYFIDDAKFDKMEAAGEFAETLHVDTTYGIWKYGARKEDLKDDHVLICGLTQVKQVMESGVPTLSVLLDISRKEALNRAVARGDDHEEVNRRFDKDELEVDKIKEYVDMVLNACNSVEENASAVDRKRVAMTGHGYKRCVNGHQVVTAQEMYKCDLDLYLSGDNGLIPYLRKKDNGMPKNPIDQIAWLLLQGGSCGFCKVCRPEPCGVKDGEKCTTNIANYIRDCVHAEDAERRNNE